VGQGRNFENSVERLLTLSRMEKLKGVDNPLYAAFRIGGLYDTHVGQISDINGIDRDDAGLSVSAGLGYQFPMEGKFGFRMDYGGYADFHLELSEFNVQGHHFSIEPQYADDQLLYRLSLGVTYNLEGGHSDSLIKSISPSVTYLMSSKTGAIAVYGNASQIEDEVDTILNEDGTTFGGGISYIYFKETFSTLLAVTYSNTDYESFVKDYVTDCATQDKRTDKVLTSTLNISYHVTSSFGIYATYSFIHSDSNVDFYDHDRHIFETGIAFKY
jgi:outer membrane receptor protein involved in Fe transport